MTICVKAPGARLNYMHDWGAARLGEATIDASEWRVEPVEEGGIAIDAASCSGSVASVTVTGGIAGGGYDLVNRITLSTGEVDERAISLRVEAR